MNYYIQYHNADARGYGCQEIVDPVAYLKRINRKVIGNRVLLVAGKSSSVATTKRYFGCYIFDAEELLPADDPVFRFVLRGKLVHRFEEPILMNAFPWFATLKSKMANFSRGLSLVPDECVAPLNAIISA